MESLFRLWASHAIKIDFEEEMSYISAALMNSSTALDATLRPIMSKSMSIFA